MFPSAAGCVLMVYILCISGVGGKPKSIFALKWSSVKLSCSAQHSAAYITWYIVSKKDAEYVYQNVSAHATHEEFSLSEDHFTLTVRGQTECYRTYCCSETIPKGKPDETDSCQQNSIQLQVTDLQVKVFPASEGQKVTLMCSSSCSLTESPAAFIWYQNGEFLYEDWSPWYQELVSSDQAVRYSCAVKGFEDLRAPDVSVDSVSGSCFSVTYAEGRMCSSKSQNRSCSITFPTEVRVERTTPVQDHCKMTCNSSCSLTDSKTSFQLYTNTESGEKKVNQNTSVIISSQESFFCTMKDHHDMLSNEVCVNGRDCWSVSYDSRRICGLKGSSVNISSKYSHPEGQTSPTKRWYKKEINTKLEEEVMEKETDVNYQDMRDKHILMLNNLDEKNSGEYEFRMETEQRKQKSIEFPGVTLIVTGLLVDVRPAAEVTEGQRVTLTCSTSCPLSENTNYIWYLNSRPLSLTQTANKRWIIDAVSRQDEGNYSCSVGSINSTGKTLTVQRTDTTVNWKPAAAGLSVFLLVLVPATVFLYRKFKPSHQSSKSESADNMDDMNEIYTGGMYEEFEAQPAKQELHYSQIALAKINPIYSNFQQHQEQEHVCYSALKTRTSTNSDSAR